MSFATCTYVLAGCFHLTLAVAAFDSLTRSNLASQQICINKSATNVQHCDKQLPIISNQAMATNGVIEIRRGDCDRSMFVMNFQHHGPHMHFMKMMAASGLTDDVGNLQRPPTAVWLAIEGRLSLPIYS